MKCGGICEVWCIVDIVEIVGVKCMVGSMMEFLFFVSVVVYLVVVYFNIYYFDFDVLFWLMEELEGMIYFGLKVNF